MQLSSRTLDVLKNFSVINQALVIRPGNVLRTRDVSRTMFAEAKVPETFEQVLAVHNLSALLGTLNLLKGDAPELSFTREHINVKSGRQKVKFVLAEESLLKSVAAPAQTPPFPEPRVKFKLPADELQTLLKAMSVLSLEDVLIEADSSGRVTIKGVDKNTQSKNVYESVLDGATEGDKDIAVMIPRKNIAVMPGDYTVGLHEQVVSFESDDVKYWVGAAAPKK